MRNITNITDQRNMTLPEEAEDGNSSGLAAAIIFIVPISLFFAWAMLNHNRNPGETKSSELPGPSGPSGPS